MFEILHKTLARTSHYLLPTRRSVRESGGRAFPVTWTRQRLQFWATGVHGGHQDPGADFPPTTWVLTNPVAQSVTLCEVARLSRRSFSNNTFYAKNVPSASRIQVPLWSSKKRKQSVLSSYSENQVSRHLLPWLLSGLLWVTSPRWRWRCGSDPGAEKQQRGDELARKVCTELALAACPRAPGSVWRLCTRHPAYPAGPVRGQWERGAESGTTCCSIWTRAQVIPQIIVRTFLVSYWSGRP